MSKPIYRVYARITYLVSEETLNLKHLDERSLGVNEEYDLRDYLESYGWLTLEDISVKAVKLTEEAVE